MYLLAVLFLVLLEFSSEGFKARQWHVTSEWIEFVYRAVVTIVFMLWVTGQGGKWIVYDPGHNVRIIVGYLFLRFGIGNIVWNICAGEDVTYIGFTKSYDKALRWVLEQMRVPVGYFLWVEVCLAVTGAGMLLFLNR